MKITIILFGLLLIGCSEENIETEQTEPKQDEETEKINPPEDKITFENMDDENLCNGPPKE